ncbi:MAG: polyprenyl synthetase family protein [Actinomycetota bacterium]
MTTEPAVSIPALDIVRDAVDPAVREALEDATSDLGTVDPRAGLVVEEIARLVDAGGKRIRPAFCVWGFRAGGGDAGPVERVRGPIVRVAAALELLHTMALIHDDLMDEASERRGVASTASHLTEEAVRRGFPVDAGRFGRSGAILAGDLAAVLADRLMVRSGFSPEVLVRALVRYHEMRIDMAAGQMLDVAGLAERPSSALAAARLKGGSYSVEGPLLIGATLAAADSGVTEALRAFGTPLGEAFQLRDDLLDHEGAHGATPETVNVLVTRARAALRDAPIDPRAADALDELARAVAVPR